MLSKNQKIGIIIGIFILCLAAILTVYKLFLIKLFDPSEQDKAVILSQPSAANQKNEYQGLIEKYAINTQTLNIGKDCQMDPLIIKFKGDSTLVIANKKY